MAFVAGRHREALAPHEGRIVAGLELLERLACVPRFLRAIAKRSGIALTSEAVQELAQEAIVRIWERLDGYEGRASLESWAYPICLNTLRDHWRALGRAQSLGVEEALVPARRHRLDTDERRLIQGAIERLDRPQREVVRLRHFDELSFEEIADRLELPPGTIKSRYYRSLGKLRSRLGAFEPP